MEHKIYLKFLTQVASASSGSFQAGEVLIFFWWNQSKATMSFSTPLDHSGKEIFEGGAKVLKWSNNHPYFEIKDTELYLTQDIQGIPTYTEFKWLMKSFLEIFHEFSDQSMGVFPHPLR